MASSLQKSHEEEQQEGHKSGGGVLEAARGAAERARKLAVAGDTVARKGETDESAWQQGQDVRRRAAEKASSHQEERPGAREPTEAEKGLAATENIYGRARGAMDAFGEKMVTPTDVVERKRAETAAGDGNAPPPKATGREQQSGGA
ncbi:hypothetical protein PR202_gb26960 [Eleusine coracana subsp. coracana]|uniref:Uncharacterized protein n=1 Tax=Eleusine coracana subsp. coracana TaxID=191504 RepID=A0AAV5FT63_ELECO|nr:hypothetical protein PR202_gb26960 [Eleusine coracana subsp. coracana]